MSLTITVSDTQHETCDKCKKGQLPGSPLLLLWESSRGNQRNVILIHKRCLDRLADKAVEVQEAVNVG